MRVLVIGFDGSADSRRALDWAAALARGQGDVELHLVEAIGVPTLPGALSVRSLAALLDEHETERRALLEREAESLRSAGFAARGFVRRWLPAETLVEHATELGAELLVVGTHGSGRARFLLGSVSGEVVRSAHQPVLLARGSRPARPPRRALLALDGSLPSQRAARVAARWCPDAELLALHVRENDAAMTSDELAQAVGALGLGTRTVELRLSEGHPAQRILELIAAEEIDLLATGTRGMGPLAELLLGSVSDKLIQLANCPVLLSR